MRGLLRLNSLDRDLAASSIGAFVYSCALGLATVVLPLLALAAGYSKSAVGYVTALSAVSQMCSRLFLAGIMRRFPDWVIVFSAGGFLALSCALVALSSAAAPFAAAELLQGVARACFWTGSQTHVVRGSGSSVSRLATVNYISSVGLLIGPIVGGFIGKHSIQLALWTGAAIALAGMAPPMLLDRLPPFTPWAGKRAAVWRRSGVMAGSLAGITAGTWRGMLSSYVPVALQRAGESSASIGIMIAVANGTSVAGSALMTRVGGGRPVAMYAAATVVTGGSTAFVAAAAGIPGLEATALALSGVGAGILQAIGPSVATDAVGEQERGDAIAVAGTYRAAALFAAPLGVGASLTILPLNVAIVVVGGVITLPALVSHWAGQPTVRDSNAEAVSG